MGFKGAGSHNTWALSYRRHKLLHPIMHGGISCKINYYSKESNNWSCCSQARDSLETQSTSQSSAIWNCQNHWIHQKIMLSMTFHKWLNMLTSYCFFGVKILKNGLREGNRSIGWVCQWKIINIGNRLNWKHKDRVGRKIKIIFRVLTLLWIPWYNLQKSKSNCIIDSNKKAVTISYESLIYS